MILKILFRFFGDWIALGLNANDKASKGGRAPRHSHPVTGSCPLTRKLSRWQSRSGVLFDIMYKFYWVLVRSR